MHLNIMSLEFSGPQASLEPLYKKHLLRSTLFLVRISFFLGALLYGSFGILDALMVPEQAHITWLIRYAIVCPGLLLVVAATYVPRLYPFFQPILFFWVTVGGLGIVLMILVAPEPINHYYYAGLILVLMFGYAFSFLKFIWASLAGLLIIVSYNVVAVWSATPGTILISNNFFLVSANIIGMVICYVIEYMSRRNFFLMRQVEEAKDQLEERITERTADLKEANRQLSRKIREHEKAVEALRQSESKYRLIAEGMNDCIWTCDTKLGLTYVSPSVERLYGFSPEEWMTQTLGDMMTPASRKKALKTFVREMARENTKQAAPHRSISLELEFYRKDGSTIFVETVVTCIHDQHGTLVGWNGVDRDISSRKQAETELMQLNDTLEQRVEDRTRLIRDQAV
jgi:PAS domain S-box-containing protein